MKFKTFDSPRPHMIINEFFTQEQLGDVLFEIAGLERHLVDGLYTENNKEILKQDFKKNKVIRLDEIYGDRKDSHILSKFDNDVWGLNGIVQKEFIGNKYPEFEYMKFTKYDDTQLSIYGDGDFYKLHTDIDKDISFMTMNVMLCNEPKRFNGGEFVLKWHDDRKVFPFENNTCIIYPQTTPHEVLPVVCKDNSFECRRYSLNHWSKVNNEN